MHDNAKPHIEETVSEYIARQSFEVITWPSMSCDLNIIENVWGIMLRDWPNMPIRTHDLLREVVQDRWNDLRNKPGNLRKII